jgi:uncharacterized LabA/DUF88 family protein
MSLPPRYAILLDGAFVIKKLKHMTGSFPATEHIQQVCDRIKQHEFLLDHKLLRIYFYHAPPAEDRIYNPLSEETRDLSDTEVFRNHDSLLKQLELKTDFALRLGDAAVNEWKLGSQAMESMMDEPREIEPRDLVPNISQKGVDLRIGLDIARLTLRELVDTIVVATGDSDLVPAFKFARREGVRVYLDYLEHGIKRELKAHTDHILELPVNLESGSS